MDTGKKEREKPVPKANVEIRTLQPGHSFTLNRVSYIVSAVYPFAVIAARKKPSKLTKPIEKLPPDTLVKI